MLYRGLNQSQIKQHHPTCGVPCRRNHMDFGKVLLTCDDNNIGSAKIIEANGGILENIIKGEKDGESKKRRYWITIKR